MKPVYAKFVVKRGVPRWIELECWRTFTALLDISPPTKPVEVFIVPAPAVTIHGRTGFGATRVQKNGRGRARIYIAGDYTEVMRDHKIPKPQARKDIGETLAHEWAHYEQWRDGRPIIERGVRMRAANLYRRVLERRLR